MPSGSALGAGIAGGGGVNLEPNGCKSRDLDALGVAIPKMSKAGKAEPKYWSFVIKVGLNQIQDPLRISYGIEAIAVCWLAMECRFANNSG